VIKNYIEQQNHDDGNFKVEGEGNLCVSASCVRINPQSPALAEGIEDKPRDGSPAP
jgi:hypothetical protein